MRGVPRDSRGDLLAEDGWELERLFVGNWTHDALDVDATGNCSDVASSQEPVSGREVAQSVVVGSYHSHGGGMLLPRQKHP